MLIIEIALGIVLAVLILRYLPQMLSVGIGVAVLCIVLIAAIAIFENYPRFLGAFLLGAGVLGIEKYTPSIKWVLLLFSSFLAFIISIVLMATTAFLSESVKLSVQIPEWLSFALFLVTFLLFTWLIYRLIVMVKEKSS